MIFEAFSYWMEYCISWWSNYINGKKSFQNNILYIIIDNLFFYVHKKICDRIMLFSIFYQKMQLSYWKILFNHHIFWLLKNTQDVHLKQIILCKGDRQNKKKKKHLQFFQKIYWDIPFYIEFIVVSLEIFFFYFNI